MKNWVIKAILNILIIQITKVVNWNPVKHHIFGEKLQDQVILYYLLTMKEVSNLKIYHLDSALRKKNKKCKTIIDQ